MQVAQGLGADTINVLYYANSGDSPYGNQDQVVGYGAVMFWRYDPPELTEVQRQELLVLTRSTLEYYLRNGKIPSYTTEDPDLVRRSGVFITLKQQGELRGCIGHIQADTPLSMAVQQVAVQAATMDSRFPPVTPDELDDISIEISILSPFHRIKEFDDIKVGTHGLRIYKDGQSGIFLPQVAVEQDWDREEWLDNLCLKAGLPAGCWKEGAAIYSFTTMVFNDE